IIKIPIPENYRDCLKLIKSDQYRIQGTFNSSISIILHNLKPFTNSFLFWFRLCQHKGFIYPLCKFMLKRISIKYLIDIPASTRVGYGFYIGHGICIVINSSTIIGNNVNISQFLNIGTNHQTPAVIGNNVYIAPHVSVVEDVIISNNVTIGAGSVVVKNIPANATAVGVYAKVINYNNPARYIKNKWE
ncbi:MAG: hypothetical protein IKQ43_01780, partial [Treponema sp.]|nr:hypothetical protein [Treponema sp.]